MFAKYVIYTLRGSVHDCTEKKKKKHFRRPLIVTWNGAVSFLFSRGLLRLFRSRDINQFLCDFVPYFTLGYRSEIIRDLEHATQLSHLMPYPRIDKQITCCIGVTSINMTSEQN